MSNSRTNPIVRNAVLASVLFSLVGAIAFTAQADRTLGSQDSADAHRFVPTQVTGKWGNYDNGMPTF